MKTLLFIMISLFFLSCNASKDLIKDNNYYLSNAYKGIIFFNYRIYLAVNNKDSTFLIVTEKNNQLPPFEKYEKIRDRGIYKLTLEKIDSTLEIRSNIGIIVDDSKGKIIYKDNHFLVPLYASPEIYNEYIKID